MPTAPTTTNVSGLLTLAHARSTLTHVTTSGARRPPLSISGLLLALRAVDMQLLWNLDFDVTHC